MTVLFQRFLIECAPHGNGESVQGPDRPQANPQRDAQLARGLRRRGAARRCLSPGAHCSLGSRSAGPWVGRHGFERALLIASVLFVLVVELLNSAVEATVDRISFD